MNELKDGKPTGRLNNEGTLAEVECYVEQSGIKMPCGTRWVPVTAEMRAQMTGCVIGNIDISTERAKLLADEATNNPTGGVVKVNLKVLDRAQADRITPVFDGRESAGSMAASYPLQGESTEVPISRQYEYTHVTERCGRPVEEHSGGNVNYYSVPIEHPKRPERTPYIFEVEDLIEALNMTFHEGTVLKSLVRSCVERELGMRKVGADYIRDAEKMVHSSAETLRIRKLRDKRGLK